MVLPDAEHVEPDLVRELGLLDDLAQTPTDVVAVADVGKREDPDLQGTGCTVRGRVKRGGGARRP